MFCSLHFRYKALVPRLYPLLGTSQTGFKRGPSSCSSALSKMTKWWEQATITFRLACQKDLKLESLIPKFAAERIEPENASKRVVRCRACTSWCNYDQDRHRLRAHCAAALSERVPFFSGRSGSSRRGRRGEKRKVSSKRVGR